MTQEQQVRHVGVVGLAVMGANLARNLARNGFATAVYNRTASVTEEFLANEAQGTDILGTSTIAELVASLERPRRILLMVKAGPAVDAVIEELAPYLEEGDILIDGGNSFFQDTERRSKDLANRGFNFVGMGVSGGEEGALWGPSLMPGGPAEAYAELEPMLTDSQLQQFLGQLAGIQVQLHFVCDRRGGPLLQHDVNRACLPAGAPADRPGEQYLPKRHDQQNGSAEVGDSHHDEER